MSEEQKIADTFLKTDQSLTQTRGYTTQQLVEGQENKQSSTNQVSYQPPQQKQSVNYYERQSSVTYKAPQVTASYNYSSTTAKNTTTSNQTNNTYVRSSSYQKPGDNLVTKTTVKTTSQQENDQNSVSASPKPNIQNGVSSSNNQTYNRYEAPTSSIQNYVIQNQESSDLNKEVEEIKERYKHASRKVHNNGSQQQSDNKINSDLQQKQQSSNTKQYDHSKNSMKNSYVLQQQNNIPQYQSQNYQQSTSNTHEQQQYNNYQQQQNSALLQQQQLDLQLKQEQEQLLKQQQELQLQKEQQQREQEELIRKYEIQSITLQQQKQVQENLNNISASQNSQQTLNQQQPDQKKEIKVSYTNYGNIRKKTSLKLNTEQQNQQTSSLLSNTHTSYLNVQKSKIVDQSMTVQEVIEKLQEQNKIFIDSQFQPNSKNIGGDFDFASWKKITQIYENPQIFQNTLQKGKQTNKNEFQQGELGDSYLVASLSALAEQFQNIRNLINENNDSHNHQLGVYSARINWMGVWKEVIIDNYFPVWDKKPCFTSLQNQDMWVLILEKVWAKLHGSYCKIDAGLTREALHDLTGAPTRTYFTSENQSDAKFEDVWNRLKYSKLYSYIITCTSRSFENDSISQENLQNFGLNPGQSYNLLEAKEFKIGDQTIRLVKIRNSISNQQQQQQQNQHSFISENRYDDKWVEINEYIQNQLKSADKNQNQGIQFMEYHEFAKYFESAQICYHSLNNKSTGMSFRGSKEGTCFKVTVPVNGVYYFQVSQKSIRTQPFDIQDYIQTKQFYNNVSLICAHESNINQCVVAVGGCQRDLTSFRFIDRNEPIQSGIYYVYVEVEKGSYNSLETGFSVYGPRECSIERIENSEMGTFPFESSQTCQSPYIEKY